MASRQIAPEAGSAPEPAEELHTLAARALAHFQAGTTDSAASTMSLPVAAYLDQDRYNRELDAVFRSLPLAVALSLELPAPGTYRALTVLNTPIILVRGSDGTVRAFLNVCRHRGARLCADGAGQRARFSCPYHAWTYDDTGALVGLYGEDKFGAFERSERGLTELACSERSGVVFACLDPAVTFDIDRWLGGMQPRLDTLDLTNWVLYEQRDLDGPGWKVTLDGYLEVYHHDIVHRGTVGAHTLGNLLVHDTFGPHQRLTFARKNIGELAELPEDAWQPEQHTRIIHSVFPNLSISGIVGGHCLVSQIFPGVDLDHTITRQSILCAPGVQDAAWQDAAANFSQLTLEAVRDEDYAIGRTVQDCLRSGANEDFLLGRNEPAVQHYHEMIAAVTTGSLDALTALGISRRTGA